MITDSSLLEDHALALEHALKQTYATLRRAKRLVRKDPDAPAAVLDQLNDIRACLDAVYAQAELQQSALQAMALIAQELRRDTIC